MLVKMKISVAYKNDTLNPDEVFDLPESVAKSLIDNDMADESTEAQTRTIRDEAAVVAFTKQLEAQDTENSEEGGETEVDEKENRIDQLCKEYTVPQLRELFKEWTGENPGNRKERTLAEAIVEAQDAENEDTENSEEGGE